jgi:hypothetical protein
MSATTKVLKDSLPLWLAVGITVLVSMPFGLWLGQFNFTLWCGFIVWAEYFALGAKPAGIKLIIPSFCYAAALTSITLYLVQFFGFIPSILVPGDLAVSLLVAGGVAIMVWTMKFSKTFQNGSLPFFNGISMALAIYFSGSFPKIGPDTTMALVSGGWTILMCLFGVCLGVFNVWILFPREVESK